MIVDIIHDWDDRLTTERPDYLYPGKDAEGQEIDHLSYSGSAVKNSGIF
jgi:hypothetical protein